MTMIRWVLLPSIGASVIMVLLALACRWIWRTSRPLGLIVAAGLAVRLAAAMVLFWTSYLQLPLLSSLQLGNGFWRMALDAPGYHLVGMYASESSLASLTESTASPAYVQALAVWMRLAGTSPFSAVLLNLTCYVTTCALLLGALRGLASRQADLVRRVTLLALTASPMLLFVSTQVLKDDFFLLFSALLSTGVWWIALMLGAPSLASWRRLVPGLLAVSVGVFVTAGVRVYYPAIASLCFGPAFIVALFGRRRVSWPLIIGSAALTLVTAGTALTFGSQEGQKYRSLIGSTLAPGRAVSMVDKARAGFISSGGTTNIGQAPTGSSSATGGTTRSGRAPARRTRSGGAPARTTGSTTRTGKAPTSTGEAPGSTGRVPTPSPSATSRLRGVAIGLATMFVPLAVLRALGLVAVSGGSAMMALGDLDTLFFDAVFATVVVLAWRMRRELRPNPAFLTFAVGLVVLLCVLMGYTVTNVGTLVRLRLMVLVPLVTMPLAFSRLPRYLAEDDHTDSPTFSAAAPTRAD